MVALPKRINNRFIRSLAMSVVGFLIYGGWAYIANESHGSEASTRAALTQGTVSFLTTFVITLIMETAFSWASRPKVGLALSFVAGALPMYTLAITAHQIMGTPELASTVALPLTIGTFYCGLYSLGLMRSHRDSAH